MVELKPKRSLVAEQQALRAKIISRDQKVYFLREVARVCNETYPISDTT